MENQNLPGKLVQTHPPKNKNKNGDGVGQGTRSRKLLSFLRTHPVRTWVAPVCKFEFAKINRASLNLRAQP